MNLENVSSLRLVSSSQRFFLAGSLLDLDLSSLAGRNPALHHRKMCRYVLFLLKKIYIYTKKVFTN